MRKLPIFNKEEIDCLYDLVMKSDDHLIDSKLFGGGKCLSFDSFKNNLANSLTKYKNVLTEMKRG